MALWIIVPPKPPYPAKDAFVKVEILQGGRDVGYYRLMCLKIFSDT
jgi:hypothetical protein